MEDMKSARILAQFKSESGELVGSPFDLPLDTTAEKLQLVCQAILQQDENTPYAFFVNCSEITGSIGDVLRQQVFETEKMVEIIYQPQSVFWVRAVSRCTSTIAGHAEAVICVAFSPSGRDTSRNYAYEVSDSGYVSKDTTADDRKLPADAEGYDFPNNLRVVVYQGDIAKENADIVVNSCNEHLGQSNGVSSAIAKVAGPLVKMECENHVKTCGQLLHGDVHVTGSGHMNCKKIIHAVSPQWAKHKKDGSVILIKKILRNIFAMASLFNSHSVALPGLGCGGSQVPKQLFATAMASSVKDLDQGLISKAVKVPVPFEIRLVDIDKETTTAVHREIAKIAHKV